MVTSLLSLLSLLLSSLSSLLLKGKINEALQEVDVLFNTSTNTNTNSNTNTNTITNDTHCYYNENTIFSQFFISGNYETITNTKNTNTNTNTNRRCNTNTI